MPEEPTPEDLSLSAKLSNYQEQGDVPRSVDLMLRFGARSIKFGLSCEKLQDSINRIADIYGHYLITLSIRFIGLEESPEGACAGPALAFLAFTSCLS